MSESDQDKFVAMVSAKANVSLPLSDFHPHSTLIAEQHKITKPASLLLTTTTTSMRWNPPTCCV